MTTLPILSNIKTTVEGNLALSHGIVSGAIEKECTIYKNALQTLTDELTKRDEYIIQLHGRLNIPRQSPSRVAEAPHLNGKPQLVSSLLKSEPNNLLPRTQVLATGLSQSAEINNALVQKIIKPCEEERDIYKTAYEDLAVEVEKRNQEIQQLEEQLDKQTVILSSPNSSPSGSPIKPASPDPMANMEESAHKAKLDSITEEEKKKVLENLTFINFVRAKKPEEVDIETMSLNDPLLESAAKLAIQAVTKKSIETIKSSEITPILASLEYHQREFGKKLRRQENKKLDAVKEEAGENGKANSPLVKEEKKLTLLGVKQLVGQVEKDFARYMAKLRLESPRKKYKKYSDFIFNTLPCCAAELHLLEKRYLKCKQRYTELKGGLKNTGIDELIANVDEKLKTVLRLKNVLDQLLQKCHVEQPKN
ncbi:MAG TPA: hypothetical protein VMR37_01915 [Rhabdochlamydiaceae bacterium]|nr:hypothetical protein [Rhabdochlamydiaceae bacterium]